MFGQAPSERGANRRLPEEAREAGDDRRFERFDQRITGPLLRPRLNLRELTVCETFQPDRAKADPSASTAGERQGGQVRAAQLELLPRLGPSQLAHGSLQASGVGA